MDKIREAQMTGVYVLIYKKKYVYVGQTTRWPNRIAQHKFYFDEARFFPCDKSDLLINETRFIRMLKPMYNVSIKKRPRRLLTDKWILDNFDEIKRLIKRSKYYKHTTHKDLCEKAFNDIGYSINTSYHDIWRTIGSAFEKLKLYEGNR